MSDLIASAVANAVVAAALACAAWAAARFVRRPALTHALCLLVLVKLVTPPLFTLPLPAPGPLADALRRLEAATAGWLDASRVGQAALGVWVVGAVGVFLLQLRWTSQLRSAIECATPAPPHTTEAAARIAKQMGLRRCPPVRLLTAAQSPMLCGVGPRICIVLPTAVVERLAPAAQDTIVAHELAHYARRDHWVRVVEMIATGCFWWHPAVWWARRQMETAEEQCCDALVMEHCQGQKRAYAEAILDVVEWSDQPRRDAPPLLASALGGRTRLAGRLRTLLNDDRPKPLGRGTPVLAAAAAVILIIQPDVDLSARGGRRTPAASNQPAVATSTHDAAAFDAQADERDPAWATAVAPNGAFTCTVRRGYRSELTEIATGRVHDLANRQTICAAFVDDGARLVVGDQDGTVDLIDCASGRELDKLLAGSSPIRSLDVSTAADRVAAADETGRIWLASLDSHSVDVAWTSDAPIHCLRFSPDGSRLAIAYGAWHEATPGGVEVIDLATRQIVTKWSSPAAVGAIRFASDDGLLTADWAGRVDCYRISDGRWLGSAEVAKEFVSAEVFSPQVEGLARLGRQFNAVMRRDSVW
jgi:bla regulator protein BlaR1